MNRILLLLAILTINLLAFGQGDAAADKGKVYFMRSTGFQGSAQGFTTFIDDVVVCKLNNKRYSVHEVSPGMHRFSVQFAGKNSKEKAERIEINIEPGKTYYIQLIFQTGIIKNNLYCQEVTESSAKTMMNSLREDDCR